MISIFFGISLTVNILLVLCIILYLKFKLMTKKELNNLKEVMTFDNSSIEEIDSFLDFFHKN